MPRSLSVIATLGLMALPAAAQEDGLCLACHDDVVTAEQHLQSLHGEMGLACVDCHADLAGLEDVHDEVQPAEVLEQTFDAFEAGAAARGVLYQRNIAALPPIVTDATRMQQIVSNLIENALRRHKGRVADVMRELNLPRRTLNEKMAKHGLTRDQAGGADIAET